MNTNIPEESVAVRVAAIMLAAFALFTACELSAQPSTDRAPEGTSRLVLIAAPEYTADADLDNEIASYDDNAHYAAADVTISDVGVFAKRNLVYLTLDASDDVVATVDVYAMNGSLVARPLDRMLFSRGKQRFAIDLPSRMHAGTYLLKVSTPHGVLSRSFVLSR